MSMIINPYAFATAGGVPTLTPPDSTNLVLWLDALQGVYNDAGSTLATNGQTVQQWNDQSGKGHNVSQATSGNRPSFITGTQNGLPIVEFSNASGGDWLAVGDHADLEMDTDSSVFCVIKYVSVQGQSGIVHKGNAYFYYLTANAKQEIDRPFNSNGGVSTTDLGITIYHAIGAIVSGTGVSYFVNGSADGTTTVSTGSANANDLTIGEFGGGGRLSGRIGELLIWKTALNSTDRGTVFTYLQSKWGL